VDPTGAFFSGAFGAAVGQFLTLLRFHNKTVKTWPKYMREKAYWIIAGVYVLIGAGWATLYATGGWKFNAVLAAHVGLTWPVLVERAADESVPEVKVD
jgi:hypothetical protein